MYINIVDGYIVSFGKAENETETEEYITLKTTMNNRPIPREGYDYRLKENLEWEEYELPTEIDEREEITNE